MVAANFACSRPTKRALRNVVLKNFGFIGIEAKRKPAVITAWTTPFDVFRPAPDWPPQIDQVPRPFEHLPPRLLIVEIYHATCRGAVAAAALWKEKSGIKLLRKDEVRRIAVNFAKLSVGRKPCGTE